MDFLRPLVEQGFEIVHFCLGSALSAAYQNCCAAAEELGHVYPVDARSLSTGIGLQVIEAAEMARTGLSAAEIQAEAKKLADRSHASFILDTLEFMHAGGRCSTVAALGANLLKLKPCIEVHPEKNGAMEVGKKYRGDLKKVLVQYTKDTLNRDDLQLDRVFITPFRHPAGIYRSGSRHHHLLCRFSGDPRHPCQLHDLLPLRSQHPGCPFPDQIDPFAERKTTRQLPPFGNRCGSFFAFLCQRNHRLIVFDLDVHFFSGSRPGSQEGGDFVLHLPPDGAAQVTAANFPPDAFFASQTGTSSL